MYTRTTHCRACGYGPPIQAEGIKAHKGAEKLIRVFSLGIQPLANDFVSETDEHSGFAPLEVLLCPRCHLAQLSVTVRPEILYRHYCYRTSPSKTMQDHFVALSDIFKEQGKFTNILEIGSNDGLLLSYLGQDTEVRIMGIDPAENLERIAQKNGVPTVVGMFNSGTAAEAVARNGGLFNLIIARHVFCHIDDWQEFVRCLDQVGSDDAMVSIEVPWVKNLLERGEYDTIYHEHTSYFSISGMQALLKDSPFKIQKVIPLSIHGGALLVLLRRKAWVEEPQPMPYEDVGEETWTKFAVKSGENIYSLRTLVRSLRAKGKRVIGYGASAKSTVVVNACGFTKNDLAYITDTTLEKMWKLSPGTDIPILPEGTHVTDMPDYAVMFCWNFCDEVIKKNQVFLNGGGKFILPVPEVKIIP